MSRPRSKVVPRCSASSLAKAGGDFVFCPGHRTPCKHSVGATLAVARGRGRAPPLRTTRYTFFGAGVLNGPRPDFPRTPGRAHGPCPTRCCVIGTGRTGSSAPTHHQETPCALCKIPCHCEASAHTGYPAPNPSTGVRPVPLPLGKGGWVSPYYSVPSPSDFVLRRFG